VFYTGYISSIIEYACIVWGIGNKTNSNKIIKLQERAARIVLQKTFKTSSKLMFNELKWLSFPTICIYYTNVMIFKSLNNQTPTYVKELLTFSNNSFYNLRSTFKNCIVNDKPNTKFKSNSFSYFGMKTWNELPKCIMNSPSVESC